MKNSKLKQLRKLQKKIRILNEATSKIYEIGLAEIGVESNDWTFDYVFNCSGEKNDRYQQFVEEKLKEILQ